MSEAYSFTTSLQSFATSVACLTIRTSMRMTTNRFSASPLVPTQLERKRCLVPEPALFVSAHLHLSSISNNHNYSLRQRKQHSTADATSVHETTSAFYKSVRFTAHFRIPSHLTNANLGSWTTQNIWFYFICPNIRTVHATSTLLLGANVFHVMEIERAAPTQQNKS